MKLPGGVLLSALCSSASAATQLGRVYISGPVSSSAPQQPPSVSPETARLILAQRLGVSQYHSVDKADNDLIRHLNAYSGKQEFFSNGQDQNDAHVLVWVEGVEHAEDIIKDAAAYSAAFDIRNPPSAADNDRLLQDLIKQASSLPKKADPQGHTYNANIESEAVFQAIEKTTTYNDFLTVFRSEKLDKASAPDLSAALDSLVRKISDAKKNGWSLTVVLMPASSSSKRIAHPYGTYAMPSSIQARREPAEQFMSLASVQPSSEPQLPDNMENFPTIQSQPQTSKSNSSRVLGILPPYFSTQADCESRTRNCSGHGSCSLVRKSKDKKNDRFGCVCKPTVVKVGPDHGMEGGKKKTTYWGGPACQKKDISTQFWLFVASGVILAGLISAGIGMLYSMGEEELPSVIGAGVSGPTRK